MGQRLGCGAHLESLRRTAVGEFTECEAARLEQLEEAMREGKLPLLQMASLLPEFPAVILCTSAAKSASHGNAVAAAGAGRWIKLLDESGELIAIAERDTDGSCHPVVVVFQR